LQDLLFYYVGEVHGWYTFVPLYISQTVLVAICFSAAYTNSNLFKSRQISGMLENAAGVYVIGCFLRFATNIATTFPAPNAACTTAGLSSNASGFSAFYNVFTIVQVKSDMTTEYTHYNCGDSTFSANQFNMITITLCCLENISKLIQTYHKTLLCFEILLWTLVFLQVIFPAVYLCIRYILTSLTLF